MLGSVGTPLTATALVHAVGTSPEPHRGVGAVIWIQNTNNTWALQNASNPASTRAELNPSRGLSAPLPGVSCVGQGRPRACCALVWALGLALGLAAVSCVQESIFSYGQQRKHCMYLALNSEAFYDLVVHHDI